jgi:hypothetical protein
MEGLGIPKQEERVDGVKWRRMVFEFLEEG